MDKNVFLYSMNEGKETVIIVAGGSGSRMQSSVPKQFLEIDGKAILMHTIDAFQRYNKGISIVLVLPAQYVEEWQVKLSSQANYSKIKICIGGSSRTESVRHGLAYCEADGIVAIHDAARPFVSSALIEACFKKAAQLGAIIPCIACTDSVRISSSHSIDFQLEKQESISFDRSRIMLVQTPQCFDAAKLKQLYASTTQEFSDDASLWESAGEKIYVCEGEVNNFKITSPLDLKVAKALIALH